MRPRTFNDWLAIALGVVVIPSLWGLQGCGILELSGEVTGATIVVETLIAQFYFRKKSNGT